MDGTGLSLAVGALARTAVGAPAADQVLRRLCEVAVTSLDADGVAVRVVDTGSPTLAHACPPGNPLTRLLQPPDGGPWREAVDGRVAVSADGAEEIARRWSGVGAGAADTGVGSLAVLPLTARDRCWGTLDLYRAAPGGWTAADRVGAQLLADVATSYLVMAADRADVLADKEHLAARVLHDELTGLPNRGLIHELIDHALAAAERHRRPVAVLFVDLDRFKEVNDTHGHAVGDRVLQAVASRMRAAVRSADTVGRLSGDEFAVLVEDLPAEADQQHRHLVALADRVSAAVATPVPAGSTDVTVSASIGITVTTDRPAATDLLDHADAAMYAAKAAGRSRTVVRRFVPPTPGGAVQRRRLYEALDRGEFRVHYQPIVTTDGGVVAVEALLRWQHPDEGLLPAVRFIEAAQATGAIVPIGRWLLTEVAGQLRRWRADLPDTAPGTVFCNLCPREIVDDDLIDHIATVLATDGLTAADLGVEVLESHLGDDRLVPVLDRLRSAGHPVAIDDFGVGYSSLHRLVELPVSHLKLDRSFTARLPADRRARTVVDAVAAIATGLGLQLVGEGVETPEQARCLVEAGADLLQGFRCGAPMAATEVTALLTASGVPAH
ncbi:putative bifunctional diguanylate cyclase/phosphodiesterase [Nakamurella endophytica]|uniref:Diguanylate cyclase (GGDEF)-like protein n=1 Tax=Nakamurella endophytica TaxID=1748367 RepID=A0A917WIT7_9ACTN|nr:EAL domain-containing protein [Nakamurella endophytica]GGM08198.1 hypothetical protein GCM10011594_30230 [Nakamurella endophytica]